MGIKNKIKKNFSFTLLEIIIVIGIISTFLPLIFGIFYSIINQQLRIYQLTQIKREGDNIIKTIEAIINNYAISIHSNLPPSDSNEICIRKVEGEKDVSYFNDIKNYWFRFYLSDENFSECNGNCFLASRSAVVNPILLNSNINRVFNLQLRCYRTNDFSPPIIKIAFSICYWQNNSCGYTLNYRTSLKLKNY